METADARNASAEVPIGRGVASGAADIAKPNGGAKGLHPALTTDGLLRASITAHKTGLIDDDALVTINKELSKPRPNLPWVRDVISGDADPNLRPGSKKAPTPKEIDPEIQAYLDRRAAEEQPAEKVRRERQPGLKLQEENAWFTGRGMPVEHAQNIVDEVTKGMTNIPKIQAIKDVSNAPVEAGAAGVKGNIRGFLGKDNNIYTVASSHSSPSEVKANIFHELWHYASRSRFGDKIVPMLHEMSLTNGALRAEVKSWMQRPSSVRQRMGGLYKNMTEAQYRATAADEVLADRASKGPINNPGLRAAWDRVAATVRNAARRVGFKVNWSDNDIANILRQAHEHLYAKPGASNAKVNFRDVSLQQGKQAEPHQDRNIDQMTHDLEQVQRARGDKRPIGQRLKEMFMTHEGREQAVTDWQNQRRAVDTFAKHMNQSGKPTDIADQLTLADSRGHTAAVEMEPHVRGLQTAVADYIKKAKLSTEEGLRKLQLYSYAVHEPERRYTNWVENVPLSNKKEFTIAGKNMSAADWREAIMLKLHSAEDLSVGGKDKALYKQLEWLAKNKAEKDGSSPHPGLKDTNIDSPQYNVVGGYSKAELDTIRDAYAKDPHRAELDKVMEAKKNLDEVTKDMDKRSGLWTQPVENIVNARGWKNYMSFKGDPTAPKGEQDSVEHMRSDFAQFADATKGRHTDSDNPFLQAMTDAGRAAGRVGRTGVTGEVKRLIDNDLLEGNKVRTVKFEDRYKLGIDKGDLIGKNNIFHSLSNGDVEVYRIKNDGLAEAIKGSFHDVHPLFSALNKVTGSIGRLHTRYNITFAPYNFIRHAMTSSLMTGVEKGGATMAKIQANVAKTIVNGGIPRAAKMALMYENGDMAGLKKLAESGNEQAKNIYEYLQAGGFVKYQEGFSMAKHQAELQDLIGPSKVATSLEHVNKYFDVWNDTFEFAGRAAAYGPVKEQILERMKGERHDITSPEVLKKAQVEAAAYTKNLFNYSQVGKYGREAGSMFMFLRPALTTAVRSIDAIAPAFQRAESLLPYLPKAVREDPEAVKKFIAAHEKQQKMGRVMLGSMLAAGAGLYELARATAETDDQGRNKMDTDDMELWTRNIRLPLHGLGGKENDYLQIPWGFGLGAWGALGAQMTAWASGNQSFAKTLTNMIPAAMDSYLPLPVAKFNPTEHPFAWVADSVAPSFARPALEYAMNVDEFGREIYNNRTSAFGDAYVGGEHLPELYGMVTRFLADNTNGQVDISPNTLHFFTNNYMDGIARIGHNATGLGLTMADKKDFDPKRDLFVLDSFLGKSSSYDAREFSDVEAKIKKQAAVLNMYKERPDQLEKYEEANPNARMAVAIYNSQVNGPLKTIREEMKRISASSDDPKDKQEQLRDLRKNRDWLMRSIIDSVQDYLD